MDLPVGMSDGAREPVRRTLATATHYLQDDQYSEVMRHPFERG